MKNRLRDPELVTTPTRLGDYPYQVGAVPSLLDTRQIEEEEEEREKGYQRCGGGRRVLRKRIGGE